MGVRGLWLAEKEPWKRIRKEPFRTKRICRTGKEKAETHETLGEQKDCKQRSRRLRSMAGAGE